MSWATGTASDHLDLISRLVTFLTTDSALVSAGQNWTSLRSPVALPFTGSLPAGRIGFGNSPTGVLSDAWPTGVDTGKVRMKITGTLSCPTTGSYGFVLNQSDWTEVRIDGTLVFSRYSANYSASYSASADFTVSLSSGNHSIDVRTVGVSSVNLGCSLGWKKPGDASFAIIPSGNYSGLAIAWAPTYGGGSGSSSAFTAIFNDVETILKGPGLSGADQVFVSLNSISNFSSDYFNIRINGPTGYTNSSIANQPGIFTESIGMLLWAQPMKYWFIANGRRFIVIAKVSTSYEAMYGGFLLPYGLPTEVPYPMAIGGSASILNIRFSDTSGKHGSFWRPSCTTYNSGTEKATLAYRDISGNWNYFTNFADSTRAPGRVFPTTNNASPINFRTSPDGSYALTPLSLFTPGSPSNVWGEMDGVYHIPGFGNAAENIVTISGQDYLVVQGGNRTANADYAAIKLA